MPDHDVPTPYHMKLLANQDFDFSPFWEEAMVNWLHRNSSRLLKVNPQCCKHFIGDPDQKYTIANHIPLTNEDDIVSFLLSLPPEDTSNFEEIAPRLINAGKADLLTTKLGSLAAMQNDVNTDSEEDPTYIIEALSDKAIIKVFDHLDWYNCRWHAGALAAFLGRLNKIDINRLSEFPVERLRPHKKWRRNGDLIINKARNRAAVFLAYVLPKEQLNGFIARFMPVSSIMECMSCGEITAKSMPGYTLHRKVCDTENKWPNALVVAATRLA